MANGAFFADDRTVKLWEAAGMKEISAMEKQPDWAPALAFVSKEMAAVGRLDGSIALYEVRPRNAFRPGASADLARGGEEQMMNRRKQSFKGIQWGWIITTFAVVLLAVNLFAAAKKPAKAAVPKIPPGTPEIFQVEPRGIQRGVTPK